jgi:hypothetical protein
MDDILTIFTHIPKTAGTTLRSVADVQYAPHQIVEVYGAHIANAHHYLRGLSEDVRRDALWLRGHISFGCHAVFERPYRYITLLRDPLKRVVSLYNYILRDRGHHLHAYVRGHGLRGFALGGVTTEADNGMVRQLCGLAGEFPQDLEVAPAVPFGRCTRELLEVAKQNLAAHYAVVGLVERFDDSLAMMCIACGWVAMPHKRRNVTRRARAYDRSIDREIAAQNALDYELYRHAEELFNERRGDNGVRRTGRG